MNLRSKLQLNKKAYLQLDLAFALLVFIIFFVLVYGYVVSYKSESNFNNLVFDNNVDSENICKLLIKSEGSPQNWNLNVSEANFYGL